MSTILPLLVSLFLVLSGPQLLGAKTAPKADNKKPETTASVKDLEAAAADLEENIKDLRRNITNWRKIQHDAQLTPAEKKSWREKADTYLKECEAYEDVLAKIDAKKMPESEVRNRFLKARQTFQRELNYLRETLQMP
jgi:hypothetical protein